MEQTLQGRDDYNELSGMIDPILDTVRQVDGSTTHFVIYSGKCPRENLWNAEGYTSHAEGRTLENNASWRGLRVIDSAVPPSNINYGNGLNGILFNVLKSLKLLYSTFETISMAAVIKKSEMIIRAVKSLNE